MPTLSWRFVPKYWDQHNSRRNPRYRLFNRNSVCSPCVFFRYPWIKTCHGYLLHAGFAACYFRIPQLAKQPSAHIRATAPPILCSAHRQPCFYAPISQKPSRHCWNPSAQEKKDEYRVWSTLRVEKDVKVQRQGSASHAHQVKQPQNSDLPLMLTTEVHGLFKTLQKQTERAPGPFIYVE